MIAIQDHGTNESSLETLPLFGAIKRRKFLKICCNLIDTNREVAIPEAFNTLKHARTWVDQYYHWYNHKHRHSGICYITPQQCYEGKGPGIMKKRNDIIDIYYQQHKDLGLLRDNITSTGNMRRCLWQMPAKVEVMPFYTKRARVKNVIRAKKLDIETPACNDSNLEVV